MQSGVRFVRVPLLNHWYERYAPPLLQLGLAEFAQRKEQSTLRRDASCILQAFQNEFGIRIELGEGMDQIGPARQVTTIPLQPVPRFRKVAKLQEEHGSPQLALGAI